MKSIDRGRKATISTNTDIKLTLLNDYSLLQGGNVLYGELTHFEVESSSQASAASRDIDGPDVWNKNEVRSGAKLNFFLDLRPILTVLCGCICGPSTTTKREFCAPYGPIFCA